MTATHTEGPSSYPPAAEFAEQANAREDLYHEAEQDRLAFWAKQADRLSWTTPFTEVLDWSAGTPPMPARHTGDYALRGHTATLDWNAPIQLAGLGSQTVDSQTHRRSQ